MSAASRRLRDRRVLLVGGGGFLGRALTPRLEELGASVVWLEPRRVVGPRGVRVVSWREIESLAVLRRGITDVVLMANFPRNHDFPAAAAEIIDVHLGAPLRIASLFPSGKLRCLVLFSTGSIYDEKGPPGAGPIAPGELPPFFVTAKLAAELLLRHYARNTRVQVIRLFRPYGPGGSTALVNRLAAAAVEGREVQLDGRDGPRIQPIHVDDVARAVTTLLSVEGSHVADLAGKERVTLGEIVRRAARAQGARPRLRASGRVAADDRAIRGTGVPALDRLPRIPLAVGLCSLTASARSVNG